MIIILIQLIILWIVWFISQFILIKFQVYYLNKLETEIQKSFNKLNKRSQYQMMIDYPGRFKIKTF